jgi:hypothetical protein
MPFRANRDTREAESFPIVQQVGLKGGGTRLVGAYVKEQLSQCFLANFKNSSGRFSGIATRNGKQHVVK